MPATESTWREMKLMHAFFGVTALLMLIGTVWMLAADHSREWKQYQRKFRRVETWTTEARIREQETSDYVRQEKTLAGKLEATQAAAPARDVVEEFATLVASHQGEESAQAIRDRYSPLAAQPTAGDREKLLAAMRGEIKEGRRQENNAAREMRFARADLDVARSDYERALGEEQPAAKVEALEQRLNDVTQQVGNLTRSYQELKTYRTSLEGVLARIQADETAAAKTLADHRANVDRLSTAREESRLSWGESLLELPILDAFGRPLTVDQIWLPNLTINYNFRDVARFDRCITCHRGMEKTAPGSATDPAYPHARRLALSLATPETDPRQTPAEESAAEGSEPAGQPKAAAGASAERSADDWIEEAYGLRLAAGGIEPADVTVDFVHPGSRAARAGIEAGDVLVGIQGVGLDKLDRAINRQLAVRYLWENVRWGESLSVDVRRGLPHPYSSHPRLDLFVGPLSPHKMQDVGCTVCHDGQGSATQFQWASHSPNTPAQREEWGSKYGWYPNHHWIFPIYPQRFAQSTCLKCHHDVTELEPSERFPDPPAEKLVEGYHLIRRYGCFGCHEINGFNGPDKRIGPDLRAEPNITAAALQLLAQPGVNAEQQALARRVADHPEGTADRKLLAEMIRTASRAAAEAGDAAAAAPNATALKLADQLGADIDTPGQQRKVGPSLRHVAAKADFKFLYDWIREPKAFRPTTRMPQFFGLWDHLAAEPRVDAQGRTVMEERVDAEGHRVRMPVVEETIGLTDAKRFEAVEIYATTHYLLGASQPFAYLDPPAGVTASPSVERGQQLFEMRGCLACHTHKDFPEAKGDQGPDLSRMAAKLTTPEGKRWLASWVREPNRYHARTVMPNLFLEPITEADGTVTDPAADITEYLLSTQSDYATPAVPELVEADLDALVLEYLSGTFTQRQAKEYLAQGIPESRGSELKGDEVALLGAITRDKKLDYIGRRTITKLGCSGCHDIPGYEDAKPIGTGLADWGRKDASKLAFEQIALYLSKSHGGHGGGSGHAAEGHGETAAGEAAGHGHLNVADMDPDTGYFVEKLLGHEREGFIWQKLREPRSYDYKKTENKGYNERLRMPKFPFTDEQVEAVITFVLGLVSEPPRQQYVYQPDARQHAIQEGRRVLDRYNCAGCHVLGMEKWQIEYDPEKWEAPPAFQDFAFTIPHFSPERLDVSKKLDARGLGSATLVGQPVMDETGAVTEAEDADGNPAAYFQLWESVPIHGDMWVTGVTDVLVSNSQVTKKYPYWGGDLARLLYPKVLEAERGVNPNVKPGDAWGWVPPPLVNEGRKVQTGWLHDFLLDPYPIRPAAVLRMPKFNMSSAEAGALVDYFAAVDGVEYPYEFDGRTRASYLASRAEERPSRLDDALKLVTNRNFCVQCHHVGDFRPEGSIKAQAPNLDRVHLRMRPEFLRAWIANPKRLLPYTGMPVNFPPDKQLVQDIFPGDSETQIDAVVDLLLNFDTYMKEKTSIKSVVPPPTAAAAPDGAAEAGGAAGQ